ncbi:metallophosphoesterase family protein [Bacillus solimangrovi]|uniref:Phosphoesterase n=1 Tax=Bacillus solimangrovi TaxID=1305675 RepID=A0A1E5LE32_9BACI|nr:metallophosphoesterase family protein [Bacillus solimangrovi]OEH92345.1 phosphoesterase [Bacillus solimangrovi]
MKVAALYDIHGNLPALNAVLNELKKIQPDLIVVGGDIVSGPMPRQTLERLIQLEYQIHYIRGNCDREVVMAFDNIPLRSDMSAKGSELTHWVADQLTHSQRDFLSTLPEHIKIYIDGLGDFLFCHATPSSDEEIFTPITSQERLRNLFNNIESEIIVCGHTHIQFKKHVGSKHILNAGSVGMPFADSPGADWLLITSDGYEFKRTMYDTQAASQLIRANGGPQADEFVEKNVLTVPPINKSIEMLELMAKNQ